LVLRFRKWPLVGNGLSSKTQVANPMPGWHREDIIAALHKLGTTLEDLGLQNNKARSSMSAALLKPSRGCNQIISEKLGVELHELWPAWFDASGHLISQRRHNRGTASSQKRNRKLTRPQRQSLAGGRA
jgi:Ner family transcriptional regulator